MWYTNINYSNPAQFSGGILARVNGVEVSDIYFSTANTQRMCRDMACPIGGPYMIYKAFMGTWGKNSKFTRVWAEHFEVGAWLGGYDAPYPVDYTDGLIISTPTGSTAYALSGGGPIMHPSLDAMVLVPLNPHTLSSRPIVVAGNSQIRIVIGDQRAVEPQLTCDGQTHITTQEGDEIIVHKKGDTLRLIHPMDYDFYGVCRSKLGWAVDTQGKIE
ncbi:MAG: hypothetical protein EOO68_24660 [Moraxellaceae bacterium]|nr:MAG: hypothetical protein EOO68_24660 [Moraxellaceae bacterium]